MAPLSSSATSDRPVPAHRLILPLGMRVLVQVIRIEERTDAGLYLPAGAKEALSNLQAVEPYDPGKPCEIKVEFKGTGSPAKLRYRAGVELLDGRTIVSRADDWWTAWKQFFF